MSDSGPIDLADLQLKPQWIDDLDKPNPFAAFEGKDARDNRKPRRDGRGGSGGGNRGPHGRGGSGGGNRGPHGPGGGGGGGQGQQRGNRPPRPQGDRRQGGGGNKPQGDRRRQGGDRGPRRGGQGRGPGQGPRQQRPDRPPLYELIDIEIIPDQAGVEAVAKQIKMTGRSYPIFDLARLSLGGPERYHAKFTLKPETTQVQLVECRLDRSLWLSMGEAVRHFSNTPLFSQYYKKQEIEVEPPKGNFSVIAVCGLSGALLGPPNFHSYQKNLMDLHQRKFSRMHIDGYKRKIQMVRDEETIEKWKNSLTKSTQYVYIKGLEAEATKEQAAPKAEEPSKSEEQEASVTEGEAAPVVGDTDAAPANAEDGTEASAPATEDAATPPAEGSDSNEATPAEEAAPPAEEAPKAEIEIPADAPVFKSKADAEKHFLDTHGKEAFASVKSSTVPGNTPAKLLSGALHNMLTRNAERQQRLPMPMVRNLSPLLEKAGLRFFKLGKKEIYVARSRPRPLSTKLDVSPRIRSIIQYIRDNEKQDLNKLVTALVPNAAAREGSEPTPEEIEFLKDLRWLIREGYVIEFSSGELRLGSLKSPLPTAKTGAKPSGEASSKSEAKPKPKAKKARKRSARKRVSKRTKSPAQRLRTRVAAIKIKRRKARREDEATVSTGRRARTGPLSAARGARLTRAKRVRA